MINIMNRNSQRQGEINASDSNERSAAESQQSDHVAPGNTDFIKQLKQHLEETRLPASRPSHSREPVQRRHPVVLFLFAMPFEPCALFYFFFGSPIALQYNCVMMQSGGYAGAKYGLAGRAGRLG
jgi:hypothetical protein